uniref:SET domain-containing protein n=1 Tax=Aureoumbra lagunensis TaxID=44058 RepID=A0A7S3K266_9STRA|mmetsp:Transcript_17104/g.22178  ORF Transcript_17104/g.22178 Transcript_17104/m.22178 type:complete len:333 (+) Transcript_17104:31-1029(+)
MHHHQLVEYLVSRGAFVSIEIRDFEYYGRGLWTRRNVEALEVVMSVPLTECIRGDSVIDCAQKLHALKSEEPNHPWFAYLDDVKDLPLLKEDEELTGLGGGPSLTLEKRRLQAQDLLFEYALVESRAYWINNELVLIPLLDLANHRTDAAYVEFGDGVFSSRDDVVLLPRAQINHNSQIFSSYLPDATNLDTFLSFGFVDEDNTSLIALDILINKDDFDFSCNFLKNECYRLALRISFSSSSSLPIIRDDEYFLSSPDDEECRLLLEDFILILAAASSDYSVHYFFERHLARIPTSYSSPILRVVYRDHRRGLLVLRHYVLLMRGKSRTNLL